MAASFFSWRIKRPCHCFVCSIYNSVLQNLPVRGHFPGYHTTSTPGRHWGMPQTEGLALPLVASGQSSTQHDKFLITTLAVKGTSASGCACLELGVLLQAVGVVPVAAVVGAHGWLHVTHAPRLRPQHAQKRRRVHCACAHLRACAGTCHVFVLLHHITCISGFLLEVWMLFDPWCSFGW